WELIPIESIATPEEIRTARNVRRRFGKHVIPAPTFEVQKSFSGYLVDPLRFIFRQRGRRVTVEKSVVRPTFSSLGHFYIAEEVLVAIAERAAAGAPGVERVAHVAVQARPEGVWLTVEVVPAAGGRGPAWVFRTLEAAQRAVVDAVEAGTGLGVLAVDVRARRLGCAAPAAGQAGDREGATRDGGRAGAGGR
ncbi:MAG: hypothetical protein OWV35_01580, partial [Firmicutes bacterium]|nr:hypothetical protein [Bacillota bacterium]